MDTSRLGYGRAGEGRAIFLAPAGSCALKLRSLVQRQRAWMSLTTLARESQSGSDLSLCDASF